MKITILFCLMLPYIMGATFMAFFKRNILRLWVGILWFFGAMITVVALWQSNATLKNVPAPITLQNMASIVFILAFLLILSEGILNLVQNYVDIPDFIAA